MTTDHYPLEYLVQKDHAERLEEQKVQKSVDARNQRFLNSTRTRMEPIVDMRDAYQDVIDKNHTPAEEEVHFRRYTSGSIVDGPSLREEKRTTVRKKPNPVGEPLTQSNEVHSPTQASGTRTSPLQESTLRWGVKQPFQVRQRTLNY